MKVHTQALVCTVNLQGIAGKGIALACRNAFADWFRAYRKQCQSGELAIGRCVSVPRAPMAPDEPTLIINFPTKIHPADPSRLEWIQASLPSLVEELVRFRVTSVTIPALGCGNGGLDWNTVRPLIQQALGGGRLPVCRVEMLPLGKRPSEVVPPQADIPSLIRQGQFPEARAAFLQFCDASSQTTTGQVRLAEFPLTACLVVAGAWVQAGRRRDASDILDRLPAEEEQVKAARERLGGIQNLEGEHQQALLKLGRAQRELAKVTKRRNKTRKADPNRPTLERDVRSWEDRVGELQDAADAAEAAVLKQEKEGWN